MNFYKLNRPTVSIELFENEILAINLKTGRYHSIQTSGAVFLSYLLAGNDVETTITKLAVSYNLSSETLNTDFTPFLEDLVANEILVMTESSFRSVENTITPTSLHYTKPLLDVHTDMENLVLLS